MKAGDVTVGFSVDAAKALEEIESVREGVASLFRIQYECDDCGTAYTETQYDRELAPACGRCGGGLAALHLFVLRRQPAEPRRGRLPSEP